MLASFLFTFDGMRTSDFSQVPFGIQIHSSILPSSSAIPAQACMFVGQSFKPAKILPAHFSLPAALMRVLLLVFRVIFNDSSQYHLEAEQYLINQALDNCSMEGHKMNKEYFIYLSEFL